MNLAYISSNKLLSHKMTVDHPEQPARLTCIKKQLQKSGVYETLAHYEAEPATQEQIQAAHNPTYIKKLQDTSPSEGLVYLDRDTALNPFTLEAATLGCGAVVQAVDLVMSDQHQRAFCAVRPPGHHASRNKAMGFCIFNNIAIGTLHAMHTHNIKKIAIVDFDVHHGNGTEDILGENPDVLLCSSFQHPFYPYTQHDIDTGSVCNIELPAGTDGETFRKAVLEKWIPRLYEFKPELIMISAGFDAHVDDGLADMRFQENDFRWVTKQIVSIANKYTKGRIISTLEGGYNLNTLPLCVQAHIEVLNDV